MPVYKYSQTSASNATADPTVNFSEGQAPSTLNDSCRAVMSGIAQYRDDIAGAIVSTGTSTAYEVSSYSTFDTLAHLSGQVIAFSPHVTNGATVTLNVDGLGAKPLRSAPNAELLAGTIIQGTPYVAVYNNTDGAFYLQGFYGNPYNVPLAAGMDFWGATAPNSSFAFPTGQAISRTTYATLFAIMGTTYGSGDGSTTFNLPDKTGRVSAMIEATATRLTSAGGGVDGATMGSAAGAQTKTLVTANLPAYTPSGTVSSTSTATAGDSSVNQAGSGTPFSDIVPVGTGTSGNTNTGITVSTTSTFTGTAQGGTSTPLAVVQPTIVCNYIIRII